MSAKAISCGIRKSDVSSIGQQELELVLTNDGKMVGAILTQAQYAWFLDKLDNFKGSQSLEDFKREFGATAPSPLLTPPLTPIPPAH